MNLNQEQSYQSPNRTVFDPLVTMTVLNKGSGQLEVFLRTMMMMMAHFADAMKNRLLVKSSFCDLH